ncbi:ATP-grasp domain-containing protein [Streptomyces sp. NPDC096339]|uniref:ATP-grasp domain-containing protein n=1 Tax=Streptomyces sp. NPDC096339 TaxID=3366086 RepID=UPI0038235CB0
MSESELPDVTHVMVGFSISMLADLEKLLPARSVLVVEEPDVIAAREIQTHATGYRCFAGVVPAPIQREESMHLVIEAVDRPHRVRAVIPGVEYGVIGAAALAESWSLPGAGLDAARTFRNKMRLRTAAGHAGITQPRWVQATGPADVASFRARHGGHCVLKPANRQASLGVLLLDPEDDVEAAWAEAVAADKFGLSARQGIEPLYMVEEVVRGSEVSVEVLVKDGEPVYSNITAKTVFGGRNPVEQGQTVPASLPDVAVKALDDSVTALIRETGFHTGLLHSEWLLADGHTPHLVECAARLPGDSIDTLIDLSYGGSLLGDVLSVLGGGEVSRSRSLVGGAAIRFIDAAPGVVRGITGVDAANAVPGVREVELDVEVGDRIGLVRNSWDRSGHVLAVGRDGVEAAERAERAVACITIETAAPADH